MERRFHAPRTGRAAIGQRAAPEQQCSATSIGKVSGTTKHRARGIRPIRHAAAAKLILSAAAAPGCSIALLPISGGLRQTAFAHERKTHEMRKAALCGLIAGATLAGLGTASAQAPVLVNVGAASTT